MCEAAAYILKDGNEELVLESVDTLDNEEGRVHMINIFGDQKTLNARIKTLNLVDHKIILEPVG